MVFGSTNSHPAAFVLTSEMRGLICAFFSVGLVNFGRVIGNDLRASSPEPSSPQSLPLLPRSLHPPRNTPVARGSLCRSLFMQHPQLLLNPRLTGCCCSSFSSQLSPTSLAQHLIVLDAKASCRPPGPHLSTASERPSPVACRPFSCMAVTVEVDLQVALEASSPLWTSTL